MVASQSLPQWVFHTVHSASSLCRLLRTMLLSPRSLPGTSLYRQPARSSVAAVHATRRSRRSGTDVDEPVSSSSTTTTISSSSDRELTAEQQAKQRMLKEAIFKINAKHGQGTIMPMNGDALDIERFSSGCLTLDRALGGGYPKGRIVEVYGPEASGKTTLALHAIAEVQRQGGNCAFIDAEHAFDAAYAARLGINCKQMLTCQPDHGEQAFNVMDELVRSGAVDLIVVDSVSALVPRSEVEGDIGTPQIGSQARLMSVALRKVASHANKCDCTIIFINQLRYKVGVMFGNPETTSGGQALKYYSSMRLDIRAKEKIMEAGKADPVGNRVKVKVVKNKVSSPYEVAEFDIMFGEGINALGCLFDVAKEMDVVEARGAHYYYEGVKLAQGRDNVLRHLKENPDTAARITTAIKAKMAEVRSSGGKALGKKKSASLSAEELEDELEDFEDDLLDDDSLAEDLGQQKGRLGAADS